MTTKTDTSDKASSTLAVSLETAFRGPLKALAEKKGCAETHLARLAIAAFLTAEGFKVPEVVEAKKGPKGTVKINPMAEKYNLTMAEFNRRVNYYLKQGLDFKKIEKIDLSVDPAPVKHREPKAPAVPATTGSAST